MFSQIKPCHAEWYWGTWPTPARENIFLYPALFIQFLQAETHAGTECPCEVAGAGLDIRPHMVLAVEAGQVNLGSGQSYTNIRTCFGIYCSFTKLCWNHELRSNRSRTLVSRTCAWRENSQGRWSLCRLTITPGWWRVCSCGVKPISCCIRQVVGRQGNTQGYSCTWYRHG